MTFRRKVTIFVLNVKRLGGRVGRRGKTLMIIPRFLVIPLGEEECYHTDDFMNSKGCMCWNQPLHSSTRQSQYLCEVSESSDVERNLLPGTACQSQYCQAQAFLWQV